MRHRKRILLLAGSCAMIAFAWLLWHDDQPRADGHTLDHWLVQLHSRQVVASNQAHTAIAKVGTNAIPHLLELVDYDPESKRPVQVALSWTDSLPTPVATRVRRFLVPASKLEHAQYAASGFRVLGPAGVAAIPELARRAHRSGTLTQQRAIRSLVAIGPLALPTLVELTKSTDHNVGCYTLLQIQLLRDDAAPLLPVVLGCLAAQDRRVTNCAAEALVALLLFAPKTVIPGLSAVTSTNRAALRQFSHEYLTGLQERLGGIMESEKHLPSQLEEIWKGLLIISTEPNERP